MGHHQGDQVIHIGLTILEGEKLLAKDRNLLGIKTTSDPYVSVRFYPKGPDYEGRDGGDEPIFLGETKVVMKTCSPKWNCELPPLKLPESGMTDDAVFHLEVADYDKLSEDDPMGCAWLHLAPFIYKKDQKIIPTTKSKWVPVEDENSTSVAAGRLHCSVVTKLYCEKDACWQKEKERVIKSNSKGTSTLPTIATTTTTPPDIPKLAVSSTNDNAANRSTTAATNNNRTVDLAAKYNHRRTMDRNNSRRRR